MKELRALLAIGLLASLAIAQAPAPEIVVPVGGSVTIPAPGFQKSVVIDPSRADFEVLPDGIRVRGKEAGQTKVVVWDAQNRTLPYQVVVVAPGDLARQRERSLLAALAADPLTRGEAITLRVDGDTAVLGGTASSQAAVDRALTIARSRLAAVTSEVRVGGAPAPLQPAPPAAGPLPTLPAPGPAPGVRPAAPLPALPTLGVKLDDIKQAGSLQLNVGEARLVTVPTEIKRALIAQDSIADVVPIPPREVAIIAKQPGDTTLMVWYIGPDAFLGQQESAVVNVHVVGPPAGGQGALNGLPTFDEINNVLKLLGIQGVDVVTRQDGTTAAVILAGTVPTSAHRAKAEQAITALFPATARITNFIEVARAPVARPEVVAAQEQRLARLIAEELPTAAVRVRMRTDAESGLTRVWLSGEAALPADRLRAEQLVRFELGEGAEITNSIVVPVPPPPAELLEGAGAPGGPTTPQVPLAEALAAALQSSGVPHERVVIDVYETPAKAVVVRGSVRNEDEQADVLDTIQNVLDEYGGDYELRDRGLNVKVARVVTEVEIIELTGSDAQQLGTIFGVPTGGTTGGGGGGGGTSDQGGTIVSANNGQLTVYGEPTVGAGITRLDPLAVSIRALINNNRARVLQKPYISSNDSQQGSVELVTDVPLPSTTQTAGGGASQSVEFRPVGIRLLVTPRINWAEPSDQIEMTIETEVSAVDFGISVNIGGSVIPGVTNRNAVTVVTVDDGETFVIGGLTSETERKNVSRIPFISEIPLIGELFKYTDSRKEQATVVVVMTPRITW